MGCRPQGRCHCSYAVFQWGVALSGPFPHPSSRTNASAHRRQGGVLAETVQHPGPQTAWALGKRGFASEQGEDREVSGCREQEERESALQNCLSLPSQTPAFSFAPHGQGSAIPTPLSTRVAPQRRDEQDPWSVMDKEGGPCVTAQHCGTGGMRLLCTAPTG